MLDNQFSGNTGNGFGCEEQCSTVMFTANRVEWNRRDGLKVGFGNDWNVTGNSFDGNFGANLSMAGTYAAAVTGNVFRRGGRDPRFLADAQRSCQVRLEGCRGLAMTGNSFRAWGGDAGHTISNGPFTPQTGIVLRNLAYSVISSNALHEGYMKDKYVDLGRHGPEFVLKDNVGCPLPMPKA